MGFCRIGCCPIGVNGLCTNVVFCAGPETASQSLGINQPAPTTDASPWHSFFDLGSTGQTGQTSPPHPVAAMEARGPSPSYNTASDKGQYTCMHTVSLCSV